MPECLAASLLPAASPTLSARRATVAAAAAAASFPSSCPARGGQRLPKPFFAAEYSYAKRELSDSMKQKIRAEYEGFGGSPDKPLQSNYFLNIMILIAGLAFLTSLLGS
ncbi:hypothetical protein C2845_PM11G07670 [Panicum miliaceum]|uniref:Uncharacterized protein n=1 Tax=Panicum miliaceum TaxID=4540 RepID=A0A3L6RPH7_PANMI|nr:hypothetical protein C2845_PM11G07670 [Panicum miliaceum]